MADLDDVLLRDSLDVQRSLSENLAKLTVATEANTQVTLELQKGLSNGIMKGIKTRLTIMYVIMATLFVPLVWALINSIP